MSTNVKGAVIMARRSFVIKHHGEDVWQQVLDRLGPEERATLEHGLLGAKWYPFSLNEPLDAAIVEVVGRGDQGIFKTIGAMSARENLNGPHRPFLTPGDPALFMARTDRIYSFYYDTGRREYQSTGPTSGIMTTYEGETASANDCLTVIGWYEEALEMCGAKSVSIVEEACRARNADVCRYRVSWQV